ncbi:hypothetical protein [Pseudolactococcus raffinolactis]|uniref:hypothetical protein n=1 Tax=Pseudolactococcus raffinolactis TaxID=1366 RepID=UPI001437377F|nr:hypothetical protein [Lactococcus raffinolactis]QIW55712.1 hypothetical protein GU335_03380 [Lactococcus raffinolactis]
MKKLLTTLLISTVVFGGVQAVSAQDVIGEGEADIEINGTLGADNTDPDTTIPETDEDWINVTLPTDTIFYNKADDPIIKAPTYAIINNSGRPVKVSVAGFAASSANPTEPGDFNLNLLVSGTPGHAATTESTSLVLNGSLQGPTSELITLANCVDQYIKADAQSLKGDAKNNVATFTYGGSATATTALKLNYTLTLKFDAVGF